ncbi:pyrroloquinoline quinone biosynthesis peptide chaperone PqqD [Acidianus ambivalens]|jgi:coenzyme PQQ biosynthesis protein PqqD|uniref:Pyrroloquinoline quinone biosynthesis peptide chaperone PqqD n=1 Tax=Acidianus ambivalens TaxID=2283 RepID=A0A650CVP3_ACIAM|nr:pyrroloquinoline quinone biosynthesis peptide chaperone PqqD [Acidianus ambivalens]MQL56531.1 pyrroloquinoline quinone biosynthesis peptide chaperone PqqD [Acidianus ambivalens]QGR21944.1 pyrroloquinoline quinone biosynthesis peptide chaperone PqqD [Acidianus ambivalens]
MSFFNIKNKVKLRKEKNGTVLFDIENEKVYVLNSTAEEIINKIKEGKSLEEIIKELKEEYQDPENKIEDDVRKFIDNLREAGILVDSK